ncbi:MAG: uncharacterized protein A8A55_1195 [Amphiamblys sp. WSBS2006]|nr:MAG: uncharacterized protein A8A55_1195 [Amphiamblys sp. WSBS2006]
MKILKSLLKRLFLSKTKTVDSASKKKATRKIHVKEETVRRMEAVLLRAYGECPQGDLCMKIERLLLCVEGLEKVKKGANEFLAGKIESGVLFPSTDSEAAPEAEKVDVFSESNEFRCFLLEDPSPSSSLVVDGDVCEIVEREERGETGDLLWLKVLAALK